MDRRTAWETRPAVGWGITSHSAVGQTVGARGNVVLSGAKDLGGWGRRGPWSSRPTPTRGPLAPFGSAEMTVYSWTLDFRCDALGRGAGGRFMEMGEEFGLGVAGGLITCW